MYIVYLLIVWLKRCPFPLILMFILYNGKFPGKFPGVATMVNEEALPAGVTTGLIPWELPFHLKKKTIYRVSHSLQFIVCLSIQPRVTIVFQPS